MDCVGCRSAMVTFEYQGVEIDQCQACQGTWLDSGELEALLGAESLNTPALKLKKDRRCPICSVKMEKIQVGGEKLELDRCPKRHGLWLDGGELPRLLQNTHTVGMGDVGHFFNEIFQKTSNKGVGA